VRARPDDAVRLCVLTSLAVAATPLVPAWAGPWLVAGAIFHGSKWALLRAASRAGLVGSRLRAVAWFVLWPGMDARAYFDESRVPPAPPASAFAIAAAKALLGAGLLWGAARLVPERDPLLAGWVGLFGMAWFLLFGVFHLLALAGQALGVDTQPLWRSPVFARSLRDFWSNRWNLAFRDVARVMLFDPLRRGVGPKRASLAVFLASGVAHDLVFSVPPRGGYGLCTAYFLIQAGGVLLERSPLGHRLGLSRGWRGWAFAMLLTAPASFLLFHPPFVLRSFVPFLRLLGALP
jgi:alginate O-acetyltransferase complex protein AlgI